MQTTAVFKTIVNAVYVYEGDSQELAIRAWDQESTHRSDLHGGVMVQEFSGDVMVRDGWILHVTEEGRVYLNPRI